MDITQKHQSYWCTKPRISALWVQDASLSSKFFHKNYLGAGITSIEIQRRDLGSPSIGIEIHAARPAVFLGRDNKALDQLRDELVIRS